MGVGVLGAGRWAGAEPRRQRARALLEGEQRSRAPVPRAARQQAARSIPPCPPVCPPCPAAQVLYGLPRLLTGSILAHETCHAYLRM